MIYLIITSCINTQVKEDEYEQRKETYINAIRQVLSILPSEIHPIIVENNGLRETYLDTLGCDVQYTTNNNQIYIHKGVNELLDMKSMIDKYNIQDDDMIIKLTGRYTVLNDTFFKTVINNPDNDAFVKFFNVCTSEFVENDSVLGLFALRCKYLKQFNYSSNATFSHVFDYSGVPGAKSPEIEFAEFVRNIINPDKLYKIHTLGLRYSAFSNAI
jgi:hypothetical protein